ncbi:MAG: restriction endonuclease subunit S [Verrucomicrobiales bacterium]|nr:restriction endonuclease subunit S [Verrucomicrobiales bacterium]
MAGEWAETCFGDVASFASGKGLHKSEYSSTGRYPVMGSNGLLGMCDRPLYNEPVITIGRVGACGEIHRTTGPAWISDNALVVQGGENCDQTFLYYVLKSTDFSAIIGGTTQPLITQTAVKALPMLLPPLAEQKSIAAVLGALDDKIELNRRMNATLEAMARALFQSWFVDFDPVRAKLDGRPPAALDPATAALFPDSFQDSSLGPIPKGWEVRSLDKTAHYLNGLALQKYPPGDGPTLPVIKIAQLRKGDSTGADRCNTELPPNYIVQDGDVLFSWSGSLEVELWCGGPGALNQHLFKVTSPEFPKWFYYLWTLYHLDEFRLIAADKATTMGHIQRGHLTAANVLIPPLQLLDAMTRTMAPLIDQLIANRIQSRTLATLRDTLLPKLLSGELSVKDATLINDFD